MPALVQEFYVGGPFGAPVQYRVGDITTNEEAQLGELRTVELHHAEEVALTLSKAGLWLPADALSAIKMENVGLVGTLVIMIPPYRSVATLVKASFAASSVPLYQLMLSC